MATFNPNTKSIFACIADIMQKQDNHGIDRTRIITSQDAQVKGLMPQSKVTNIPKGFEKVQLPFFLDKASTFYISEGQPNADVPEHSHDEGDGVRFIMSGSIHYKGMELKEGDWMFLPAKTKYSFKVGAQGVRMCYCYCCCCA